MDHIPLFTSLPPRLKRISGGSDRGDEYQRFCVESWIQAGFQVNSINSENEIFPENLKDLVRVHRVPRDAQMATGRALPYIADVLSVIKNNLSKGPFVITNADIYLRNHKILRDAVREISSGECIVERRWDTKSFSDGSSAREYRYGFDLFVFSADDIQQMNNGDLVFGVPWWDHALPIRALLSGLSRKRVQSSVAYHLEHHDRWDRDLWIKYGNVFCKELIFQLERRCIPQNMEDHFYEQIKRYHILLRTEKNELLNSSLRVATSNILGSEDALFHHLSAINIAMLDRW